MYVTNLDFCINNLVSFLDFRLQNIKNLWFLEGCTHNTPWFRYIAMLLRLTLIIDAHSIVGRVCMHACTRDKRKRFGHAIFAFRILRINTGQCLRQSISLSSPSKPHLHLSHYLPCGAFHIYNVNFQEHNNPTTVVHQTTSVGLSVFGT